jgi:hypothetical protein
MDIMLAELQGAARQEAGVTGQHNARDYLCRLLQAKHPCQSSEN